MQRASFFVLATLVTFALGGWTPSAMSVGGQLRCDHKGVARAELDKVRAAATGTAAGHSLDWKSAHGCTNRNGAWVHIDIVEEPQADGSVLVGSSWCQREKVGNWDCDYASGRGYRMTVMIAGKPRTLNANIPRMISVEAATRMMQQAIDLGPKLTLAHSCDYMPNDGNGAAALEEIRRDFQFPGDEPFAHITDWGGHWSIQVGENEMDFDSDANAADGFRFKCWGLTIHV